MLIKLSAFFLVINLVEAETITLDSNQNGISLAFGSCYDDKFKYKDIFKYINQDAPDLFIWHGDFAYISRSKRMDYISLAKSPKMLLQ